MRKILKKVMAITSALLMGVTILAGIPDYTAKAEPMPNVTRPNSVVYEGDMLKAARAVVYVKPGMTETLCEANDDEVADSCLLHGDYNRDVWVVTSEDEVKDYRVPAPEVGSNCWIIRVMLELELDGGQMMYSYYLEPYTASQESGTSDNAAPVYVYVEPAWLTTWKGLLADTDKQIADAKAGDTVILELGEYYNISNARMQQIAEKNDVTFVLHITYDKVSYSLTIEPGTEIDLSCDWYGPLKLLSMFPFEVVE